MTSDQGDKLISAVTVANSLLMGVAAIALCLLFFVCAGLFFKGRA